MFRKVYKSANDDIIPNQELLEKILATEKKSHNTYNTFYRYGYVAAALFILVGTLSVYPKISDNLKTSDNTVAIETKTEDVLSSDILVAEEKLSAEASTVLEETVKPQNKPQTKRTKKPLPKQETIPPEGLESIENSPEIITAEEPVITEAPENMPKVRSLNDGVSVASMTENTENEAEIITEAEAIRLADEVFLEDFGEEFLSQTEIKTEFSINYEVTRFNENQSYTVTVYTDGLIEKQY